MLNYKYVNVGDTAYAYTIQGSGEPLILLHGFTGTSKTWENCITIWQAHYTVITLDLPGHGQTTSPQGKTMADLADDLAAIIRKLQIKQAHFLGYSMGGRTALAIAMQRPELVKSLIMESASPGISGDKERAERKAADDQLADKIEANGIQSFVATWENIPLFATQKKLPPEIQLAIRQERLSQTEAGLAMSLRFMGSGMQASYWKDLTRITFPTLLIVGEADEKFVQLNEKMVTLIETAEMVVVKEAGHAVHIEQPEMFAEKVSKFMNYIT